MLSEEPLHYLSSFREFLVAQQSKTDDPRIAELIAEINRELLRRMDCGRAC